MIPKLTFSTAAPTLGDLVDLQKATSGDHGALLRVLMRRTGAKEEELRAIYLGHELALVIAQLQKSLRECAAAAEAAEKNSVQ